MLDIITGLSILIVVLAIILPGLPFLIRLNPKLKRPIQIYSLTRIRRLTKSVKWIFYLATKMIKNFLAPSFLFAVLLAGFSSFLIYQEKFEAGMTGAGALTAFAVTSANAKKEEKAREEENNLLISNIENREFASATQEVIIFAQYLAARALTSNESRTLLNLLIETSINSQGNLNVMSVLSLLKEKNRKLELKVALLEQQLEGTKEIEYLRGQNQVIQHILKDPNYPNIFPPQK